MRLLKQIQARENLWYILLLIFILIISFFIRLQRLDYPLAFGWGDGARDYLVAHHIKSFNEIPLIGPFNPLYEYGIRNSPFYYYLLAFFLIPYDSILTLSIINIIFQLLTLLLLYLLAQELFGKTVALISLFLFSFTPLVLEQSKFIWQPHLMQPFAYAAFYLLFKGYLKKQPLLLTASVFLLIFAGVLHNAAYILLPQLFLIALIILKKQEAWTKYYIALILTVLLSFFLFYLPVFIFEIQSIIPFTAAISSSPIDFTHYLQNLVFNFSQLLGMFFSSDFLKPFSLGFLLLFIFSGCLLTYIFFFKHKHQEKWYMLMIFLATLQLIAAISFFPTNYQHYLTLVYGLLTMLIVEAIYVVLRTHILLRVASVTVFIALFLLISSPSNILPRKPQDDKAVLKDAISKVKNEIGLFPSSFLVVSYVWHGEIIRFSRLDAVLLAPLEESLNKKLVTVDNTRDNFSPINENDYLVLACYDFESFGKVNQCINTFLADYPTYKIIKHIYTHYPFTIYLSERV